LQEIEDKYSDKDVKILAILADNELEAGKKILDQKGGKYTNILDQIMYVPTTLIVNSKGEMVGEMIAGARSTDEFSKLIEDALKDL